MLLCLSFVSLPHSLPEQALELLDNMLELDPRKRCSAEKALASPWLNEANIIQPEWVLHQRIKSLLWPRVVS